MKRGKREIIVCLRRDSRESEDDTTSSSLGEVVGVVMLDMPFAQTGP